MWMPAKINRSNLRLGSWSEYANKTAWSTESSCNAPGLGDEAPTHTNLPETPSLESCAVYPSCFGFSYAVFFSKH